MGKAVEHLVAATCLLASRGELDAATSLADDEGVDLVFNRRGSSAMRGFQVKARMSGSKRVQAGSWRPCGSRRSAPRSALHLLFVSVDIAEARLVTAWLVPSTDFAAKAGSSNALGRWQFSPSLKEQSQDRRRSYRLEPAELAPRVLDRLVQRDSQS
ncbi:hypothetical protein [Amycolatopsis sp. FDAARGOS 1241]|uniref:hypothetical protein n=1 Tax=Amycolatopsis sp. FDAARGOS 1241 TaxID=2778070 RepID=UPI00194FA92F|nr:hypothetical protein [Amycolatopsis sp. FDAARGOS 1241]QRP43154.1 hypothetical protein I6J71_27415 [Amycolatopsis sp. FDAARGOS 1241]